MTHLAVVVLTASTSSGLRTLEFLGVAVAASAVARGLPEVWAMIRRRLLVRTRVSALEGHALDVELSAESPEPLDLARTLETIARDPIRGPRTYLMDIELTNFRCFESARIQLHHPGTASDLALPNVNLVLGDNGAGKSALLKAIAIVALGPVLRSSGFLPYHLVRIDEPRSRIRGQFVIDDPHVGPREALGEVTIDQVGDYEQLSALDDEGPWSRLFTESDPAFFVVGYGANRRAADEDFEQASPERARRRRRYQRVASLFEDTAVLTPLSSWLPGLSRNRRQHVEELLAELLPAGTALIDGTGREPVFEHRSMAVPYRALSDGYRSFIGWVGDLLFQIESVADGSLPFDEIGGIVLVDEVDLLLHPMWQREVVPKIARAFPKLQFVLTTHSPIVAGTLQAGNIVLARETKPGVSELRRVDESIHGLNAEQILLSSYFGMSSSRAPGVESELGELARRAMQGDDDAALSYLRVVAGQESREDPRG